MSCDQEGSQKAESMRGVFARHPRRWQDFHYVYPVVSRRSGGLSIGINLNIDKACNFDCVYCCVDRSVAPVRRDVDLERVRAELGRMLDMAVSGAIWEEEPFRSVEVAYRRVNDVAFSGDGEPTAYAGFEEACRVVADELEARRLGGVKIVVITNATMFDRPGVRRGLAILDDNNGEVWAKLDAGTEEYYRLVERTNFPFEKVLKNILDCGREREVVIQALFMSVHGEPVPAEEFEAFIGRLEWLVAEGCRIKLVQLYTTARRTAETFAVALSDGQLDRLEARLRERMPGLPALVYYGV